MTQPTFTAFFRDQHIASGSLADVLGALAVEPAWRQAQVFDDTSGELVKLGRPEEIAGAVAVRPQAPTDLRVALLPRHIAWLESQAGGPSAAVRRLIDAARREGVGRDRQARDAGYRFLSMMAGDREGFEAACRALYAGDRERFETATANWPGDISLYAGRLAGAGWSTTTRPPAPAA